MTDKTKLDDLYINGICQCKAGMKGKHIAFNQQLHPSEHFRVYMCIRCNKPVYYPPGYNYR